MVCFHCIQWKRIHVLISCSKLFRLDFFGTLIGLNSESAHPLITPLTFNAACFCWGLRQLGRTNKIIIYYML